MRRRFHEWLLAILAGFRDEHPSEAIDPGAESRLCPRPDQNFPRKTLTVWLACLCLVQAAWLISGQAQAAPSGFAEAVQSYKAGKYSQALSQFQAIRGPEALTHYYMAICLQNLNQVTLAKQHYQWVAVYGTDPALKRNAAIGLAQLSKYRSASGPQGQVAVSRGGISHSGGGRPKVMDFFATWCGPCKRLAPILEEVESQFRTSVDFQRIDIDDPANAQLVHQYQVNAVPTLVYLDGRGQAASQTTGLVGKEELVSNIQSLLAH